MAFSITAAEVAQRLGGTRPAGDGAWYARCPSHDDKRTSLWLKGRNGPGLSVKCHAGCDKAQIEEDLKKRGLWPETGRPKPEQTYMEKRDKADRKPKDVLPVVPADMPEIDWDALRRKPPNQLYEYRDADGQLTGYVCRWDDLGGKEIRPLSALQLQGGKAIWSLQEPPGPHPLFNLAELIQRSDAPVLVVEGEKAAEGARKLFPDHVAVTWRGGAKALARSDFAPLSGRATVLWPDNDAAGAGAMAELAAKIGQLGGSARVVEVPAAFPEKWDLGDHAPDGADLRALLEGALAAAPATAVDAVPADAKALRPFVVSAADFMKVELPAREPIVEPFLNTSSLTMVFAPRGLGKTWFVLSLAIDLARGENFLSYKVQKPWNVLLIDGEMALGDLQARIRALAPEPPENFMLLASETLHREGRPINLHDPGDQAAVEEMIQQLAAEGRRPDVVVIDNLSSLSGGKDENDNSALDGLLQWLVKLRHTGLAIVLVHHAGKNGDQRGASRREDLLDTSIALKPPGEDAAPHQGAHMVLTFTKIRGMKPNPDLLELRLIQDRDRLRWSFNPPVKSDRATELLRIIWERKPATQAELAELAGVKAAAISHQMKKLKLEGWADTDPLRVTDLGKLRLTEVWPELEAAMTEQGALPLGDDCPF
jgi:hypothetical protein